MRKKKSLAWTHTERGSRSEGSLVCPAVLLLYLENLLFPWGFTTNPFDPLGTAYMVKRLFDVISQIRDNQANEGYISINFVHSNDLVYINRENNEGVDFNVISGVLSLSRPLMIRLIIPFIVRHRIFSLYMCTWSIVHNRGFAQGENKVSRSNIHIEKGERHSSFRCQTHLATTNGNLVR